MPASVVSAACRTWKLPLGSDGSSSGGAPRTWQATARMSGMFSRCPQTTVGTPSASRLVTASASPGRMGRFPSGPERSGTMNAGSIWTGAPMCPA
jgi:hypothetical protein